MDLERLANLGDFIGGVAVLVTLVYLAIQAKQVKQLTLLAAADKNAETWREMSAAVRENLDLFVRGGQDFAALDAKDRLEFSFLLNQVFGYHENFHARYRNGAIEPIEWERQQRVIRWFLAWPGMKRWWEETRFAFTGPFIELIDGTLEGFENGTIERPELNNNPGNEL